MPQENASKVNRLCRVRTISGVTLADFPLLPTDEHGFLDVAAILHSLEVGGFVNPVDVAERTGAFVLLGEPGIGKSTSLAQSSAGTAYEIPGRALTEQTLLRLLKQLRGKTDRTDVPRPQTILIDQLDESPIIQSITEIIRLESDASTFQNVKVLVGCRTAEYPSALTALLERLCGGCVVAELSPLSRVAAVELARNLTGGSGESLIREVENLGAGALACIPLTLELLAAEYRECIVHLQLEAVAALRAQSARVAAQRLKAGALWQDHDLVFPTGVGTPQDSRNLRKDLREIAGRAGYRHSFHELRHVFATIAASEVSMASLSKVLGHRRMATTSDLYAHLYDPDAVKATEAVSNVFGRTKSS